MSQDSATLKRKRAIISGANSGVGKATAELFIDEGATVGLIARRADSLGEIAARLDKNAMALPADVADDTPVAVAVKRFAKAHGGLDIAVNSAGIDGPAPLKDLTPEVWRQQIDANLSGAFYLAREAGLRMMAGDGGVIINLGSELALASMGLYAQYCASKFSTGGGATAI